MLTPAREIIGLEIQERLVQLAEKNVIINYLEDRIRIVQGDLKHVSQYFRAGEFDVLCSNPPYRRVGTGRLNPDAEQAIAKIEEMSTYPNIVKGMKSNYDFALGACLVQGDPQIARTYLDAILDTAGLYYGVNIPELPPLPLPSILSLILLPALLRRRN